MKPSRRASRKPTIAISIENEIGDMPKVVAMVEAFGAKHNIPDQILDATNLAVDELLNNIISYGYDDHGRHKISVTVTMDDGALVTEIRDDGVPFDPTRAPDKPPSGSLQERPVGGIGLHFVHSLMDEVRYTRQGKNNVVRVRKRILQTS